MTDVGIRDTALSEKLQLDPELTLEKAKKNIRQQEAVKEQQTILGGSNGANIDAIHHGRGRGGPRDRRAGKQQHGSNRSPPKRGGSIDKQRLSSMSAKKCSRCGKESRMHNKCPAKDAVCHACQKKGHYSSQCRSKTVDESTSCPRSSTLLQRPRKRRRGSQKSSWAAMDATRSRSSSILEQK